MTQCTATSKRSGEQCKKMATIGSTKCAMHGGKTPRGIASPHLKHGKYSKVLPARLLDRYHESLADEEALSMREELGLIDARLVELLNLIEAGGSPKRWKDLKEALDSFKKAINSGDHNTASTKMQQMNKLIEQGQGDGSLWAEIQKLVTQRDCLVTNERKRILEAKQYITLEQHSTLVVALYQAVKTHVHDRRVLQLIGADLAKLLNRPLPPSAKKETIEYETSFKDTDEIFAEFSSVYQK